jgi:uncharacterized protein
VRINTEEIPEGGLSLTFQEAAETFPPLVDTQSGGDCAFVAPIHIEVFVRSVGRMFEVDGRFDTRVRFSCSRCLREYEAPLSQAFTLSFARRLPDSDVPHDEADIELGAQEVGLVLFDGSEIELRDAIQEEVVMALPMQPLCNPACRGLCPFCGADRNIKDCGCERRNRNPGFAVLKGFKAVKK